MHLIRHLLRNDVLAEIKSNLAAGVWKDTLPSERQLTEQFQISRGTLRYALKNLKDEGVIASIPGSGYKIVKNLSSEPKSLASVSIGILIGSTNGNVESRSLDWIPELQQRVAKRDWSIHIHEGIPEINRSPLNGIKKLLKATRHHCWLLVRCQKSVQSVFNDNRIPAIICGSPFQGIELPSIDLNYQAVGRHAAGLLASKGHKRIGYVRSQQAFPGDTECFSSFKEAAAKSSTSPSIKVIRFKDSSHDYDSTLAQVKNSDNPLTALFVDNPFQYLRIFTNALRANIKIPEQLSLISRQEGGFLNYLSPLPSRYSFNPKEHAGRIHKILEERVQGDSMRNLRTLLLPEFVKGGTVTQVQ